MQVELKDYDKELHDIHKALCVKQPYADYLTNPTWQDENGNFHADKEIEVRSRNTNYRGDLLICSSKKPEIPLRLSGVTCGLVELYDVKSISEFTAEDWKLTCIPEKDRPSKGFGWLMRNPRRVVELPVKGQLGIYNIIMPKNDISPYPRYLQIDKKSRELINKKIK